MKGGFLGGKSRFSAPSPKEIEGLQHIPQWVYTHVHVYLKNIADSWSKVFWKRMMMIARDLHRSIEICIVTLHTASSFLFGDALCPSLLHPLLEHFLCCWRAQAEHALHFIYLQIGKDLLKNKTKRTNQIK